MTPVLIIGYGNPLRSDDGVGWHAAQALLGQWPASRVRIEAAHQLLPEMSDWLAEASFTLFIDACWDSVPGRIRCRAIHPEEKRPTSMTHHFSPQGLMADALHFFHHAPEAMLLSVGGGSFEHGDTFSRQVDAAFPHLLVQIKKLVDKKIAAKIGAAGKVETHA